MAAGYASPLHPVTNGNALCVGGACSEHPRSLEEPAVSPNPLATRSKKKTVKGAKCSDRTFTKDQVGAAYAEGKKHVLASTTVGTYPKVFRNNLGTKCKGTPLFKGLMNDLREYPIYVNSAGAVQLFSKAPASGGDMKWRVVMKKNGNFVGVMEHTDDVSNNFKACTVLEEEETTPAAGDVVVDTTKETTCNTNPSATAE